jgi:hypothetical protein
MPKVQTKLFRRPEDAKKAIQELKAKGFKAEEIGVVTGEKGAKEVGDSVKPVAEVGSVTAMGHAASLSSKGGNDLAKSLGEFWEASEETVNYYRHAISLGGIVVSVHADDARADKAREILRAAAAHPRKKVPLQEISPGFLKASRMSSTNPIDAPMSGDFRRY